MSLKLEVLESRETPSAYEWAYVGTGVGNFSTATNWVGGVVPPAGSDIHIPVNSGELNIDQIETIGLLNIDNGTTGWTPTIDITEALTVNGGIIAAKALFKIPDTLNLNGGTTHTDGSTFTSRADYGDRGIINIQSSATWNLSNTTETINTIAINNYGTINFYDNGNFVQNGGGAISTFNNYGTIIADKTANPVSYSIDIWGPFANNAGTIQLNSDQTKYAWFSVKTNTITSAEGTFNIASNAVLSFVNNYNQNIPVNLSDDTINMGVNSIITINKDLYSNSETFNFNTDNDATNTEEFIISCNHWDENGSIFNVNGPRAAYAQIRPFTFGASSWDFAYSTFNITLDETANQCSQFHTWGDFFSLTSTVNYTVVNPIVIQPQTQYFMPFLYGDTQIVFSLTANSNLIWRYTDPAGGVQIGINGVPGNE